MRALPTALDEKMFRLDGRVAVVTGGGGGIGGATSSLFANVGAKVAVLDVQVEAAEARAAEIRQNGGKAIGIGCDIGSQDSVNTAIAHVIAQLGAPTVLINGAAMLDKSGTILDIELADWEEVHRVSVAGTFLVSRAVLPAMIAAGGGSIVHIASMYGHVGKAGRVAYSSTKGALLALSKTMAIDHGADGVRVNTLSPGAVATQRVTYRYSGSDQADAMRAATSRYVLGRFGEPRELAAAALFLASDASSFMTGSDLLVDGGYCAL